MLSVAPDCISVRIIMMMTEKLTIENLERNWFAIFDICLGELTEEKQEKKVLYVLRPQFESQTFWLWTTEVPPVHCDVR